MAYDKVVDSAVLDGYFSDIADAIRDKDGTQNTYTPAQMPQAIEDIPSGGGDDTLKALLEGTATGEVTVNGLTTLAGELIFSRDMNADVTVLNLPDLETVADANNSNSQYGPGITGSDASTPKKMKLHTINIPKCTNIRFKSWGSTANPKLQTLTTINAPKLQEITGALPGTSLTQINFPELTAGHQLTFKDNAQLVSASMPKLGQIYADLFNGCTMLEDVDLSSATGFFISYAFANCQNLTTIKLPRLAPAAGAAYIFQKCTKLTSVDMGSNTINGGAIGQNVFTDCSALKALVLRHKTINSMNVTNAFTNTPIASGTGYIYVPRDLVATYQAATNWSTYSAQFRALEDYTDDGTITGEFIMPTA